MSDTPLTARQMQFMRLLDDRPQGIEAAKLAVLVHLSYQRTTEILRALRKRGLAASTSAGCQAKWATAERCKVLQEIDARRKKDREREALRRRVKDKAEQAEFQLWIPIKRSWISADGAPRLQINAPRSVFDQRA